MIPTLSVSEDFLPWQFKMRDPSTPLVDYEHGGAALNDPASGLRGYDWTAEYDTSTSNVGVYRDDLGPASKVTVLNRPGITCLGLAFDQNMRPNLCYEDAAGAYRWTYNSTLEVMEEVAIPGASSPCITLDDRRPERVGDSDILLSYMVGSNLCVRVQRELFGTEYSIDVSPATTLVMAGMTRGLAFQWRTTTQ